MPEMTLLQELGGTAAVLAILVACWCVGWWWDRRTERHRARDARAAARTQRARETDYRDWTR